MGVVKPDLVMKALIPVVMAGVIGIYGLIVAVIISTKVLKPSNGWFSPQYSLYEGFAHMGAGLAAGLSGLAAGAAAQALCGNDFDSYFR